VVEARKRGGSYAQLNRNRDRTQRFSKPRRQINKKGTIVDGVAEALRTHEPRDRNEEAMSLAFNNAPTSTKEKI
jgi:hypothetical protein